MSLKRGGAKLQQYRDTISPSKAGLKLKRLFGRQRRYVRTNIWQLANDIVKLAKQYNAKIAIEALKHLRKKKKGQMGKQSRPKVNRIPYGLLKHCLTSVCLCKRWIELVLVNSKHTSQECQKCHHISKKNLTWYRLFHCEKCGFEYNRDRNASVNTAAKASQLLFSTIMHSRRQMQKVLAQVSSGGDAASSSVSRHGLKGEGSVESLEGISYQSFRPPDLSGGS